MNDANKKYSLIAELARRRVFRSAGAYIVVSWVVVQVASIVFPEFGAPTWAMRGLIILLIVGFPPAMLLAWAVDISSKGIERTSESHYSSVQGRWPRAAMMLVAMAMSAGVLWWVWDDIIQQPSIGRPAIKSSPVIAVNAPHRLIDQDQNVWLGDGIATMIRSELAESRHVVLLSKSRWRELIADATGPEEISNVARNIGVDYLIDGEYVETPSGFVLTIHIEDIEKGIEIHSARTSKDSVANLIASIPDLNIRIKQALRIPHQEQVGLYEADFAIENVEAYEAYIAGLAYLIDFDYQAAESAYDAALAIAPDYYIARFRLAQVYEATGRSELAIKTLDEIPAGSNLSERLQLYVDGARAYFVSERDPEKAIAIYKKLVELYPYETEAGTLLAEAYWLNFQDDDAINEFRRLSEIHSYDPISWMALGERLLEVGELDEAKQALTKYASMRPDDAYAYALLGNLALLQEDIESSVEHQMHALQLKPGFMVATIGLARGRYLQGEVDAAVELWNMVVQNEDIAPGYRIDAAFEVAGVLRGGRQFERSIKTLTGVMPQIREEGLRLAMALSELGTAYMELGDIERARSLMDESVTVAPVPAIRYLFARAMLDLRRDALDDVEQDIVTIRSFVEQGTDPNGDAEKTAAYLAGLSALSMGDLESASRQFELVSDQPGYQYAIYKTGLARLHAAKGDIERAVELASQAASERDPGDLRLDLEMDRARARQLLAEYQADLATSSSSP